MKPHLDEQMKSLLPYLLTMVVVLGASFASGYLKAKYPDHKQASTAGKFIATSLLLGGVYVIYRKKDHGTSSRDDASGSMS